MERPPSPRPTRLSIAVLTGVLGVVPAAFGQAVQPVELGEITVESTRVDKDLYKVPAAMSVVGQDEIQLGRQQMTLDESLVKVPGLFMQNRHNFSQALRISMRGFGARGQFGIRGIKLLADGVPLTLPDGQGNVDEIDLGSAQRIEVIRGPSSSLYGAASGGVISVYTEDGPEIPFVQGRFSLGEHNYRHAQLKTGGQYQRLNYMVSASHLDYDGFRENAFIERWLLNTKLRFDIDASSDLTATFNFHDIPKMGDPGALTAAEVAANRKAANPGALLFDGSEFRTQERLGLVYSKRFGDKHEIRLRNYYTWLNFGNKLPFAGGIPNSNGGQVAFDRFFVGGGGQWIYSDEFFGRANRFTLGFEVEHQSDDRRRFVNDFGRRGVLTFDQTEEVFSTGVYFQNEFAVLENLELSFGLRYDEIEFEVEDRFFANRSGDDSGKRVFDELSPRVGLLWTPHEWANLYFNYSTAFETPTTTEFANPDGGGFNPTLKPQSATNYEVGIKGFIPVRLPVTYDVAVFRVDVKDELVAFEREAGFGRFFFRNAGESTREGVEAAVSVQVFPGLTASFAYGFIDARFDRYRTATDNFDGKRVPGIPEHQFHSEIAYFHPNGLYAAWDILFVDDFFADDANMVRNEAYKVANLRVGYIKQTGNWELQPFIGLNNMFNEEYNSNVRINAAGGRFFEPAPDRTFFAGFSARYDIGGL